MIYWNKIAQENLKKIFEWIKNWSIKSGFFIVNWPKNIWKKTLLLRLIDDIWVLEQDKLIIEDPWKEDWKNYIIKVSVDESKQEIEVNWKRFLDVWAREISDFISKTPIWDYKIVFIENIERFNNASANALLKNLEEPYEKVFIFTTVSNKNKLLPTILSRWTIINMFELSKQDFKHFLEQEDIILDENKFEILYWVCAWRIWLAKKLLQDGDTLLEKIEEYLEAEENMGDISSKFTIFKEIIQTWNINLFLDGLIFYYTNLRQFEKVKKLIEIKMKNQANVNLENLLFNYIL